MAKLVRKRAHRVDVVVVAHEDERPGVHGAGRERAHALAFVGVDVDPALFGRATSQDLDVFLAERSHAFGDPADRLLVWNRERRRPHLGARVVGLEHLETERVAADPPVAVPRSDVVAERAHHIVKNLSGDVAGLERRLQ